MIFQSKINEYLKSYRNYFSFISSREFFTLTRATNTTNFMSTTNIGRVYKDAKSKPYKLILHLRHPVCFVLDLATQFGVNQNVRVVLKIISVFKCISFWRREKNNKNDEQESKLFKKSYV